MSILISTPKYRSKRIFFDNLTGCVIDSVSKINRRMTINKNALTAFLMIGYVPGDATLFDGIDCLPGGCDIIINNGQWNIVKRNNLNKHNEANNYIDCSESDLVKLGSEKFITSVEKLFNRSNLNIVPLSGGFDSRAILAALLEITESKNIVTYTFGTPGTFDYEIGKKVAKKCGTLHYQFDLRKTNITHHKLVETAKRTDGNTDLLQPVFLLDIKSRFDPSAFYWTGFTGDGLGGNYCFPNSSKDIKTAINKLIEKENMGILPNKYIEMTRSLFATDSNYKGLLSNDEEIFFVNHIERYSVNHLFFNSNNYLNPFMEDLFVKFILGIDKKYRYSKYLFDKILKSRFPKIFTVPTKTDLSEKRQNKIYESINKRILRSALKSKNINYVNYRNLFMAEYKEIMLSSLMELDNKRILDDFKIDLFKLQGDHLKSIKDNSRKISLLISLNSIIDAFC